MKTFYLFFSLLVMFSFEGTSQVFDWAINIGDIYAQDSYISDLGSSVATDAEGNIYSSGSFTGTANFDPHGEYLLTANNFSDFFIQKLDSEGNFIWATSFGDYQTGGCNLTISDAGDIYCSGDYKSHLYFNDYMTLDAEGETDAFIIKYNSDGVIQWAKSFGGEKADKVFYSAIDSDNNLVLTGSFRDVVNFDLTNNDFILDSENNSDIFVMKMTSSGSIIWVENFGENWHNTGGELVIDKDNNIILTGSHSINNSQIMVLKLNSNGEQIWLKTSTPLTSGYGFGGKIALDSYGDIYISGLFKGVLDFDFSDSTYFMESFYDYSFYLLKLDNDGNFLWSKKLDEADETSSRATAMAIDMNDDILLAGHFHGDATFGGNIVTGFNDMFLQKINGQTQEIIWTYLYQSLGVNSISDIVIDDVGYFYFTGYFGGTMDFNGSLYSDYEITSHSSDAFLVKSHYNEVLENICKPFNCELTFCPNPANQFISIKYPDHINSVNKVEIFSAIGTLVYSKESDSFSSPLNINIQNFTAENYIMKVYIDDNIVIKKFTKI